MASTILDLAAAVLATMLVLAVPGACLLAATGAGARMPTTLRPAAAVAGSVLVAAPALAATLALHWSVVGFGAAVGVATLLLGAVALLRTRPAAAVRAPSVDRPGWLAFTPPGLVLVALGLVDAPQVRSDTYWHVALARRIAELDGLSSARIAFEAGAPGNANYPLPAWHALLALADQAPRVDPFFAAWASTLWLGPVAMLAFGAFAATLVGDRGATLAGCWTFVAVVVLGYGPWFFATRYLAYPGQAAIFLALPVVLVATASALERSHGRRRADLAIAAAAVTAIGVLHANYVLYPVLFAAGAAALLVVARALGSRMQAVAAAGVVTAAGIVSLGVQLPWIMADDNFLRGASPPSGEPSAFVRHRDVLVGSEASFHVELGSLATQPWLVLGTLALPAVLLLRRWRPGPWLLVGGALAIVAFARTPALLGLLDRLGSVTPATRFDRVYPAAVGVLAVALGVGWLLDRAWARSRSTGIAATVVTILTVATGSWLVDGLRDTRRIVVTPFVEARWVGGLDPTGLPRTAVVVASLGSIAVVVWFALRRRAVLDGVEPAAHHQRRERLAAIAAASIALGLAPATVDRARAAWEPQAWDRSARTDDRFVRVEVYPAPARAAASALPEGATVLAAFNDARRIASLAPVQSVEESVLRQLMADPPTAAEAPIVLEQLVREWDVDVVAGSRSDEGFRPLLDAAAAEPSRYVDRSRGSLRLFHVRD